MTIKTTITEHDLFPHRRIHTLKVKLINNFHNWIKNKSKDGSTGVVNYLESR